VLSSLLVQLRCLTLVRFHLIAFRVPFMTSACRRAGATLERHRHLHTQGVCARCDQRHSLKCTPFPFRHSFCLCRSAATPCFLTTCSRHWRLSSASSAEGAAADLINRRTALLNTFVLQRHGPYSRIHSSVHAPVRVLVLQFPTCFGSTLFPQICSHQKRSLGRGHAALCVANI